MFRVFAKEHVSGASRAMHGIPRVPAVRDKEHVQGVRTMFWVLATKQASSQAMARAEALA